MKLLNRGTIKARLEEGSNLDFQREGFLSQALGGRYTGRVILKYLKDQKCQSMGNIFWYCFCSSWVL